jgi:hypothetical protein
MRRRLVVALGLAVVALAGAALAIAANDATALHADGTSTEVTTVTTGGSTTTPAPTTTAATTTTVVRCQHHFSSARIVRDLRVAGITTLSVAAIFNRAPGELAFFSTTLTHNHNIALGDVILFSNNAQAQASVAESIGLGVWGAGYGNVSVWAPSKYTHGVNRMRVIWALTADKTLCHP